MNDPLKRPLKRGECYGGGSQSVYAASIKAAREREREARWQAKRAAGSRPDNEPRETPVNPDDAFSDRAWEGYREGR